MKKSLFIDCSLGLASDMLVAALLDISDDKDEILHELQVKICNNMTLSADYANSYERQGLVFKAMSDDFICGHGHSEHCHSSLLDVLNFIDGTQFSVSVKDSAKAVYDVIATAEAKVHGATKDTVHFHEVGQKRAIACIVCACALFEKLAADEIVFSHINTGYGTVQCAHGEVSVPAPATAVILEGIPHFYNGDIAPCELCTPSGVALVKHFASSFIESKDMQKRLSDSDILASGVGLGRRDIGVANGIICYLLR